MLLHKTNRFTTMLSAKTIKANKDTIKLIAEIVKDIHIKVKDLVSTANCLYSNAAFL